MCFTGKKKKFFVFLKLSEVNSYFYLLTLKAMKPFTIVLLVTQRKL
jgi:hypothetical protein